MTKSHRVVIGTEKHFSCPCSLHPCFRAQIRGPKARCVTYSSVLPPLRNAEILSQLNILGELWRVWFGLETLQARRPTLPAFLDQARQAGMKPEIQVVAFSPTSLSLSFYRLEQRPGKRQSVLITRARLRQGAAHHVFAIRDFVIKDLLLHGVSYLRNRTASLWQYECQRIKPRRFLMARLRGRARWAILLFIVVTQMCLVCTCLLKIPFKN